MTTPPRGGRPAPEPQGSSPRGGGGGRPAPEPQGSPRGARALPWIFSEVHPRDGGPDRRKDVGSPVDVLVDTVAWMQQDLASLRVENRLLRTPAVPQVVRAPWQAAFTTTKVSRFDGTTSWEQYRQVFDAIMRSNGWDNDTAVVQLFSHLEGDALNVALLVPLSRRLSADGPGVCSYGPLRVTGSVGGLPRTTRTAGEDRHICHSPRNISREGIWRYGTGGPVTIDSGSVYGGS